MASCIGIVTSQSGAVLHDILHVSERRNPLVQFKLFSVPVQGNTAGPVIAKVLLLPMLTQRWMSSSLVVVVDQWRIYGASMIELL